jgi:hypothetical protein
VKKFMLANVREHALRQLMHGSMLQPRAARRWSDPPLPVGIHLGLEFTPAKPIASARGVRVRGGWTNPSRRRPPRCEPVAHPRKR